MIKIEMSSLKILVIDDEVFIRKTIMRVLNDLGVEEVIDASNGAEGLMKIKELDGKFDIVLCDLEMPNMKGLAFVNELRKLPEDQNPKVPVLIVSGHSEDESIRTAAELGINGFLVKPVSKQKLENRINAAIINPITGPSVSTE